MCMKLKKEMAHARDRIYIDDMLTIQGPGISMPDRQSIGDIDKGQPPKKVDPLRGSNALGPWMPPTDKNIVTSSLRREDRFQIQDAAIMAWLFPKASLGSLHVVKDLTKSMYQMRPRSQRDSPLIT